MDVAAYVSLNNLSEALDNIKLRHRYEQIRLDQHQIDEFQGIIESLQQLLDSNSRNGSAEVEPLALKIYELAKEAERIIDVHVVDQLRGARDAEIDKGMSSFRQDLEPVIEKMASMKGASSDLPCPISVDGAVFPDLRPGGSDQPIASSQDNQTNAVEFEELLPPILDELTSYAPSLQVISIDGMGGVGKTTLARHIYDLSSTERRFDRRIWATVSQNFDPVRILQSMVKDESCQSIRELGEKLHKMLSDCRYLIVFDDIWSVKAWEELRIHLPKNRKGSRVIVTTRDSGVASTVSSNKAHSLRVLDEEKSWELLRQKALGEKGCLPEFEEIGRTIAGCCGGLPLSIATIAGVLLKSEMTVENWEFIARNVKSIVSSDDDGRCLKLLSLSYDYLPMHLKPCFLYLGRFEEDDNIWVDELLVDAWRVNGFLKPKPDKTGEDSVRELLKELVDRNLIFVRMWDVVESEEMTACGIHDLLRDLCLAKISGAEPLRDIQLFILFNLKKCGECGNIWMYQKSSSKSGSLTNQIRSLKIGSVMKCPVCRPETSYPPAGSSEGFLDKERNLEVFDNAVLEMDNGGCTWHFGKSFPVNLLWRVGMLHLSGQFSDTMSLSDWPHIEKVVCEESPMPCFPGGFVFENLTKIECCVAMSFELSDEMADRLRNLRDLTYIRSLFNMALFNTECISHFHQLQRLALQGVIISSHVNFPTSLKKLKLDKCKLSWSVFVGPFPNLERLELMMDWFQDHEWSPLEGQFPQLKHLQIMGSRIKCWRVKHSAFPRLETVELAMEKCLEEIPTEIEDVSTLRSIHLLMCCDGINESAMEILRRQGKMGNESLKLRIDCNEFEIEDEDEEDEEEHDDDDGERGMKQITDGVSN